MAPRVKQPRRGLVAVTVTVPAGVSTPTLRRWSMTARRRLPGLRGTTSIVTVSPAVSRRLNRLYRGIDRPTNVLSFMHGQAKPHAGDAMGDEIILCPTVIRREARRSGRTYRSHLRRLLEHGLIHLLGLDHRTQPEHVRWRHWERRLNPYSTYD